jgi:hypothetical protein
LLGVGSDRVYALAQTYLISFWALGAQVAQAAGPLPGLRSAADQRHHPGGAGLHHPVQLALQGGRISRRPGCGRRLDTGRGGRTVP